MKRRTTLLIASNFTARNWRRDELEVARAPKGQKLKRQAEMRQTVKQALQSKFGRAA